ncbi:MAG: ABC transporter permease [Gammaproteobacteria bacterium]|nr:ABC transporter permease [Gammaproteobacteria bacterium]MDH5303887.1 ABC transporter permease [Gammaproteobacteria bacterium]MDH5322381.1 ABC transporter permease [Gammaproteobacteria bacterium]
MLWNYIKIALRNVRKNKMFAIINIIGLSIGLTIYIFGNMLVSYERTHDAFFANSDRTYTLGSVASKNLDLGIDTLNSVHAAIGPILKAELPDLEAVARTISDEYLVASQAESFYQGIVFADPEFLSIFDLHFIHGDNRALGDPSGIVFSATAAQKYFGSTDVVGRTVTLDNEFDFRVAAVFDDLPRNSHFTSLPVLPVPFEALAPMAAYASMNDWDIAGDYNNLSLGNMTYVLLPAALDADWLQAQLDSVYERLVPDSAKEVVTSIFASPLTHANLAIWDTLGMPIVLVVQLLSFLVLVVACVNYTNLATAQTLGRSREVGMRKTMGARQGQLLAQFLVESVLIAGIAMVVAIAALEVIIPLFNNMANKVMTLDYLRTLPWLVATTLLVGLCAGLYPAWLITRASPIDALRDLARKGKKGTHVRAVMIGVQFAISAFMLSLVAIVYVQNEKVQESSYIFPRAEIYNLNRLGVETIQDRLETLRIELEALPGIDSVSWSSQVPYEQSNSQDKVSAKPADEAGAFNMHLMRMSPEFLETYDIPLLAGRNLSRDIANDEYDWETSEVVNVLVNVLALERLGIASPQDAINQRFYDLDEENTVREFVIVGVVPTQNITGLFNSEKPWMFRYQPDAFRLGSIRITGGNMLGVIDEVEKVWDRVIPEYPMQGRFLDDVFNEVYNILKYMNLALAGFAMIALALALIGLFGLAAFMAAQRTKEIGVRKVLGASSSQIARLLVWQFSKPVAWALAIALPAAFFGSNVYLNFFAERIESTLPILLLSGLVAVLLAGSTVAGHAVRIARSNPVLALRYE